MSRICGMVNLYDLKKGIYNFNLFINIYYMDKKPMFTNIVSSIDRRKRFVIIHNKNYPALKITLSDRNSMVDKFDYFYDSALKYLTKSHAS